MISPEATVVVFAGATMGINAAHAKGPAAERTARSRKNGQIVSVKDEKQNDNADATSGNSARGASVNVGRPKGGVDVMNGGFFPFCALPGCGYGRVFVQPGGLFRIRFAFLIPGLSVVCVRSGRPFRAGCVSPGIR